MGDLALVTKYLQTENIKQTDLASDEKYNVLQNMIITSLISSKKRRPAQVTKIKVGDYKLALEGREKRPEIMESLSPEEKAVAKRIVI